MANQGREPDDTHCQIGSGSQRPYLRRGHRGPTAVIAACPTIVTEHQGLAYWCPHCRKFHDAPLPEALQKAGLFGPRLTALVARCRAETGGKGPDVVITTCGSVEVHEQAIEMVAHRSYVNLFGGLGKGVRPMSVLSNTIHYKECFVTGSHGCVPRHHELAVKLLEKGLVRTAPLITHHFPLDQINDAFATMEGRSGMKIIVHPWG